MRAAWALLARLQRGRWRGLALAIAAGLAWTVAKASVPALARLAIDRGIAGGGSLPFWTALIVGVGLAAAVLTALRRSLAFREGRAVEASLRQRIFDHVLRLDAGYHDRAQAGQLMSRASSDLQQITGFLVLVPLTISHAALVVVVAAVLITAQPLLALVALAPLPLFQLLALRFSRMIQPAVMAVQAEQAQLAAVVEESISGVRVVKGFGAEPLQAAKLRHEAEEIREVSLRAARIRSRFLPALDVLPALGLIAVLGLGARRVLDGAMTVGQLVEFNAYVAMLLWPLRTIGMTVAFGQRAWVALERVEEVLTALPAVADPPAPTPLPPRRGPVGRVRFRDVGFTYGSRTPQGATSWVLDGFDLAIEPGESVAVVGATGSGKSTLARLLIRAYDVQRGAVEVDGVDVRALALGDLHHAVAVVFEETFLFHDTVAANVAFARPDAGAAEIERAARLAGADEFIAELPHGYDTLLGERGFSLSGGQRQRVAIARAVLADPRVLVLDDATSAVDPSREHLIRAALATVMRDRTSLIIAHRPATIALADRVVLLDGGRVAASGTHVGLLRDNARYREVLAAYRAADIEAGIG